MFVHRSCLHKVTFQKDLVTAGYFAACLNCDVDLYRFECSRVDLLTKRQALFLAVVQSVAVLVVVAVLLWNVTKTL
jgi:hypothetical protein